MRISKITVLGSTKILLSVIVAGLVFVSCSDDSSGPGDEDDYLQVTSAPSHGNILADEEGNVLYFFARDTGGESQCGGSCISNWPVFFSAEVEAGNGLEPGDVSSSTRADGTSQTT